MLDENPCRWQYEQEWKIKIISGLSDQNGDIICITVLINRSSFVPGVKEEVLANLRTMVGSFNKTPEDVKLFEHKDIIFLLPGSPIIQGDEGVSA